MASVSLSSAQRGRLSFSARYAASGAADVAENAAILACCEQGPLYQFFSTAYPTDVDLLDDWAAGGGLISAQAAGAPSPAVSFARDVNGRPTIQLGASSPGAPVSIRIALSYSASR